MNRPLYWLTHFLNIDGSLMKSKYPAALFVALVMSLPISITSTNHKCLENGSSDTGTGSSDTGTYSEKFWSVLRPSSIFSK